MNRLTDFNFTQGAGIIILMCVLVLGIVLLKQRLEIVFTLALRFVGGVIGIYMVNMCMQKVLVSAVIGMNPTTLLATTILGFPGLVMLYGIKIISVL